MTPWASPDQLLRAYHARYPGATSLAFADGRLADGRSSYQLLADLAGPGDAVLDLGCGDGHLLELLGGCRDRIGVDMSAEELAAARRRPALADVRLLHGRAQALPLADRSIDLAVSHLAFMLMSDLEQVVAELARVLRPGARFAAVVGGGPGDDPAFELFLRLFREVYDQVPVRAPRIGNPRARDGAGFATLFNPATGFESEIEESAHAVRLDARPGRVWDILASMYEMMMLEPAAVTALRTRFLEATSGLGDPLPCSMRVRLLVATRAPSRS
jgi:SAM-dependent methyltransferase